MTLDDDSAFRAALPHAAHAARRRGAAKDMGDQESGGFRMQVTFRSPNAS
jgi:hypothetical protein